MDGDLVVTLPMQQEWDALHTAAWEPVSLVEVSWELMNPIRDLQALFSQFKDRFFWRPWK